MNNELAFRTYEEATQVAKTLLDNNYVCMFSLEDDLVILNYEWAEYSNRNEVIFRRCDDWECEQDKHCEECEKDFTGECWND